MNAQEFLLPLLFDPRSMKQGQTVGMLYYERMGLYDSILMPEPVPLAENRKVIRLNLDARHQNRRVLFTNVGIVAPEKRYSRLIDMRDAFDATITHNSGPHHEHLPQVAFPPLPKRPEQRPSPF